MSAHAIRFRAQTFALRFFGGFRRVELMANKARRGGNLHAPARRALFAAIKGTLSLTPPARAAEEVSTWNGNPGSWGKTSLRDHSKSVANWQVPDKRKPGLS